jgi:hypothetical protein
MKIAADGNEHNNSELLEALAIEFELADKDLKERLSSGQPTFYNRIARARSHLKLLGGLLENTGRGTFRITEQGQKVMKSNPQRIDVKFLMQFPEYKLYYSKRKTESLDGMNNESETETQKPEENLDTNAMAEDQIVAPNKSVDPSKLMDEIEETYSDLKKTERKYQKFKKTFSRLYKEISYQETQKVIYNFFNWILLLFTGTLIWALSNYGKLNPSYYFEFVYIISIILIGFSVVVIIYIQFIYFSQLYEFTKQFEGAQRKWNDIAALWEEIHDLY